MARLFKILDILASTILVIAVWKIPTSLGWWALYAIGTCLFITVMAEKKLWGNTTMGLILLIIAIKNLIGMG
jgi:hypothetical protein